MARCGATEGFSMAWSLLDGEAQNGLYPESFLIPERSRREKLEPGEIVKLCFVPDGDRAPERMWVVVKRTEADGYVGALDNDPYGLDELSAHDLVEFESRHVIDIYDD